MVDIKDSYKTGYGKPPRHTRFVKGKSGNPKGRPKGSQNLATILDKAGRDLVKVMGPRGSRFISKLEASVTQLSNQAASGDLRSIREFLHWHRLCVDLKQTDIPSHIPHERDQAVMESMLKRIRESEGATPEKEHSRRMKDSSPQGD